MVQVTELGYMGIGVKDLDAWKKFATEIVGLELVDEGERGSVLSAHGLLAPSPRPASTTRSDDLLYLGWRVAGGEEFAEMQQPARRRRHPLPRRLGRGGRRAARARDPQARGSRRPPDRDLPRPGGAVRQALPSGPPHARPLQDRRRRPRPLHPSPAGHEGRVPILQRARHARRRRIQGRDGTARAHADVHALQRARPLGRLRDRRAGAPDQPPHDRGRQPGRRRPHARPGPQAATSP